MPPYGITGPQWVKLDLFCIDPSKYTASFKCVHVHINYLFQFSVLITSGCNVRWLLSCRRTNTYCRHGNLSTCITREEVRNITSPLISLHFIFHVICNSSLFISYHFHHFYSSYILECQNGNILINGNGIFEMKNHYACWILIGHVAQFCWGYYHGMLSSSLWLIRGLGSCMLKLIGLVTPYGDSDLG